ncbi:MAG: DUF2339 domain-containing protein [Lachnospiraceae bacterium]|nr:DUF2339 domain-containing protein [Lachnospiraceae bacterium]
MEFLYTLLTLMLLLPLMISAFDKASKAMREVQSLRAELSRLREKLTDLSEPPPADPSPAKRNDTQASDTERQPAEPFSAVQSGAPGVSVQGGAGVPASGKAPHPAEKVPVYTPRSSSSRPRDDVKSQKGEFFVGKIILSVTAAVLVFIGLIFLALDDKDGIPDWIRIGSMFAVSGICLVSGLLMGRKKRDNFNLALTGCGVGSLFIAILLTHVWFGYMADWAAFGLLLIWCAAALYLTRRTDSLLLSVIAHIGMVTSICFGYSLGLSDDKLILLLVYQFASSAVIIVGNMLCYRRTYHLGLLVSLAMTAAAGGFMWLKFTPRMESDAFLFNSGLPIWLIALAFYLQFIAATYLSYLLSVSAARMKNETLAAIVHTGNKVLWMLSAGVNFCLTTFNVLVPLVSGGKPYSEVPLFSEIRWKCFLIEAAAAIVIWIVHLAVTDLLRARLSFPRRLARITATLSAVGICVLLFWFLLFSDQCSGIRFDLLLFAIPALILLGYARISGEKSLKKCSYVLLAADYFFMICGGYRYLIRDCGKAGLPAALLYFAVPLAAVLLDFFFSDDEYRRKTSVFLRLFALFVTEFSYIGICRAVPALVQKIQSGHSLSRTLIPIGISLLLFFCYLFRFDRPTVTPTSDKRTIWTPVRIVLLLNEFVILIVNAVLIAAKTTFLPEVILQTVLFAVSLALAFCRAGEFVRDPGEGFLAVCAGIKLTVLVMCFLCGTAGVIGSRYAFSTVCMLTALAAVIAGFFLRSKPLRLWGLILTIACVLKLVTFDMSGASTLTHIVSFILGGVICFAISAIYTFAEKKLLGKESAADLSSR